MKYYITPYLLFIFLLISLSSLSQTQLEMNQTAFEDYKKTDKELNTIYKKLLVKNKIDTVFIKNLKASQRIWITFRDAEVALHYPEREPGYYGSIHSMCVSLYLSELTLDRIKTLKTYLADHRTEGDGCE